MAKTSAPAARSICVVGGGISGLATAWMLRRLGHQVTVLEAQSRPGGRIFTCRFGPYAIDLGGARFSDQHCRVLWWLRKLRLRVEPMYPSVGRPVLLNGLERQVGPDLAWLSPHDTHRLVSHPESWARRFGSSRAHVRYLVRNTLGQPAWYRVKDGCGWLPARLAQDLEDCIACRTQVTRIVQKHDRVEVTSFHDGAEQTRAFDCCVLAVPLETQGDIDFVPPLAGAKRDSERLGAQPAVRTLALIRDGSTLAHEGLCGFGVTSEGFEVWQPSFTAPSEPMALVLYAQGNAADELLSLDAASREQRALRVFDRMFPGVARDTEKVWSYSWCDNPWARGAQSRVHQRHPELRRGLAEPQGLLHFAGEHTAGGWIDDALASAERVVREISG